MGKLSENLKRFSKKAGINGVFTAIFVFAVISAVLLNAIFSVISLKTPMEFDLTSKGVFHLSEDTENALKQLDGNVDIKLLAREDVFVKNSTYNAQANQIIKQFSQLSDGKVTLQYIDYIKNPTFSADYPGLIMKHGDVLLTSGDKSYLVKTEDLFNYNQGQDGSLTIASSRAEEAILAGIADVTSDKSTVVSYSIGHGEDTKSAFDGMLQSNGYELSKQNLSLEDIDQNADFFVIIAPKSDFSEEELSKIDKFLINDGNYGKTLMFFANAADSVALPNLNVFLNEWGIQTKTGLVFETDENRVYDYQPFYAIVDYVNQDFRNMLKTPNTPALMPLSVPVSISFETRDEKSAEALLEFGETAGIRPADAPEGFKASDSTQQGPFPAMTLSKLTIVDRTGETEPKVSNVIVAASSEMLSDGIISSTAFNNADYMLNLFDSFSGGKSQISIKPKTLTSKALNITKQQADFTGTVFIAAIPLATLAAGVFVWLRRRHK